VYFGAVCSCSSGEGGEGEEEEGASTVLKQPSKVCRLVPVCQEGVAGGGGEVNGGRGVGYEKSEREANAGGM